MSTLATTANNSTPITQTEPGNIGRFFQNFGKLCRTPAGLIGVLIVGLYLILALFGEQIAPYTFTEQNYDVTLNAPSADYWFGTDNFGRDVLSRVIVGSRSILVLAFLATGLGLFLGVSIGLTTGYYGGMVDEILMRAMDIFMSFPSLLLSLLMLPAMEAVMYAGLVRLGMENSWLVPQLRVIALIIGIGIVFMPRVARVVRSVVLEVRTNEFVDAAKVRGESGFYIMTQEILPNATGPIIVEGSIRISYAILLGASLGYLGLGVQPPSPDWGLQVSEGSKYIFNAPWVLIFPSIAIATLVIGVNLLADGLRQVLDVTDSSGDSNE